MLTIAGGVTAPKGFRAGGVSCGIKRSGRPDLSAVVSETVCTAAGVFTTNRVRAAPVEIGEGLLRTSRDRIRGVLAISGVANAMTGAEGISDNRVVLAAAEQALGLPEGSLLPQCTGVIGPRIPMEKVLAGLPHLSNGLTGGLEGGERAAHAILTTDTRSKEAAVQVRLRGGGTVRIAGMAKGSGMIAPRMAAPHATTLATVTTDASIDAGALGTLLAKGADATFNMISVDGDTSTNDTVYALANGASGTPDASDDPGFRAGLYAVLESLAKQVAHDGEGATKLLTVHVKGARNVADARAAARAVVSSTLVKAALFGADPNVGRIACALGYSGARLDPADISVSILRPRTRFL